MEFFTVQIQTKTYLRKYLHARYGDPLIFDPKSFLGACIVGLLEKPMKVHLKKEPLRMRLDHYTDILTINFPMRLLTKEGFGYDLSDHAVISLNKLFDAQFTEDLAKDCAIINLCGGKTKGAIYMFCELHNLEMDRDITYEALQKKEQRFREKYTKTISPILSIKKEMFFKKYHESLKRISRYS